MEEFLHLPSKFLLPPELSNPNKTLDDESSPTAPIRSPVAYSLAIRSPVYKTLITPTPSCSVRTDEIEPRDSQINNQSLKFETASSQDNNIVDHVFGGRLVSRPHCCNCDSFSEKFEHSLGWSLEIEDVDNIWSALDSFTCVEKLEDQLTCDDCKEKVSKEKQLKLDKLAPVATFHLKRFKNDGLSLGRLELDLLPYMSGNKNPDVSTKYHPYAMVEHLWSGVSFGHYSYVRSAPATWHKFDDAKVTRVTEECVLQQNAYLLFYAREGTPWFSSAFNDLNILFEANLLNFSSVLESTCREESVSNKISMKGPIPSGNYSDFQCDKPQEDLFHSAESSSDDEYFKNDHSGRVAKGTDNGLPERVHGIGCCSKTRLDIYSRPECRTAHSAKLIHGLLDSLLNQIDTWNSDSIPFSHRESSPSRKRLRLKPLMDLLKWKLPTKAALASWLRKFLSGTFFRSLSDLASSEDYTCITFHGTNPKTTHILGNYIIDCDPKEMGGSALRRTGKEMEREAPETSRTEVGRKESKCSQRKSIPD